MIRPVVFWGFKRKGLPIWGCWYPQGGVPPWKGWTQNQPRHRRPGQLSQGCTLLSSKRHNLGLSFVPGEQDHAPQERRVLLRMASGRRRPASAGFGLRRAKLQQWHHMATAKQGSSARGLPTWMKNLPPWGMYKPSSHVVQREEKPWGENTGLSTTKTQMS